MATAEIIELDDGNTCKLCQNAVGKYVCPKCNTLYCSLNCYRSEKHQNCSEQFYKDSVIEELKLNEKNPEDQLKMTSILKSCSDNLELSNDPTSIDDDSSNEYYDSDDNETRSLQERLAGIDLDDPEQVWASLDEDERKEFIALTQDYKAKNIEQNWKPWWTYSYNNKVQEIGLEANTSSNYKIKCPNTNELSKFKNVCKQDPHVSVKFNLYNILTGYAFVARYFNGDHSLFPKETISFIAIISESLKSHQHFVNFESGVESVENNILENDWINCEPDVVSVMLNDLETIISGPVETDPHYYVLASLSDIHNMLKKSVSKKENTDTDAMGRAFIDEHFPESKVCSVKDMKLYIRRIEYFISYVQNFYVK